MKTLRSHAVLLLCMGFASCSRHEDDIPRSSPPAPQSVRTSNSPPATPVAFHAPAPDPPPSGANLDQVAQDAAAFEDMVASLRKFAGKDIGTNAATLDLDVFVQGKTEQDLLTFAETAQSKSPYAALQVLDHLWRQNLDVPLRIAVSERFGELACEIGYAQDRARASECMDWLIAAIGDPAQASALSDDDRNDLLLAYHNLSLTYALDASATCQKQADALRRTARSEQERTQVEEFEVFALLNSGQIGNMPAARAKMESLRARGAPEFSWVDHWLSLDDSTIAAEFRKLREIDAQFRIDEQLRFQRLESLSPAERLLEMQRQAEESPPDPAPQKESP